MKVDYIQNGNCLDLLTLLPTECIDLVVTSPPYDNLRTYNGFTFEFEKIADQLFRVLKVGGLLCGLFLTPLLTEAKLALLSDRHCISKALVLISTTQ